MTEIFGQALLEYVRWGYEHWWFFGWTAFWCSLFAIVVLAALAEAVFLKIPSRVLRTIKVWKHGWPPDHLDADGDWRPPVLDSPDD